VATAVEMVVMEETVAEMAGVTAAVGVAMVAETVGEMAEEGTMVEMVAGMEVETEVVTAAAMMVVVMAGTTVVATAATVATAGAAAWPSRTSVCFL
jgi:hypothetical protein